MRELLMVALVIAALYGLSWTPADTLMSVGVGLITLGAGVGLPTGFVYHVALYRSLKRGGGPPEGWIWRPTSLHDQVDPLDRAHVLGWCYAGAAGFVVLILGLVAAAAAVFRGWSGF